MFLGMYFGSYEIAIETGLPHYICAIATRVHGCIFRRILLPSTIEPSTAWRSVQVDEWSLEHFEICAADDPIVARHEGWYILLLCEGCDHMFLATGGLKLDFFPFFDRGYVRV